MTATKLRIPVFRCRKARPDQAGFILRFLAWAFDMLLIILISVALYLILSELGAPFIKQKNLISRIIEAFNSDASVSIVLSSEKDVEKTTKKVYLRILKERLSPADYERALHMSSEEIKGAFPQEIAAGESEYKVIAAGEAFGILRELLVGYIYFILFFRFGGRTPGKRLFGLQVVDLEGNPGLGWYQAFERTHGYAASALAASIGFLQVLWNKEGLTMHDKLAGTTVIKRPRRPRRLLRITIWPRQKLKPHKKETYDHDYNRLLR